MYKIYKIVDNTNGNVYIGITTLTLKRRLELHKSRRSCSSRDIIKNGDYKIMLIEETDDKTRERYWILNTECINQVIPGKTRAEWYEENKEKLLAKNKEYREKNREKVLKQKKIHHALNKEKHNAQKKRWHQYQVSCGGDKRSHNNLLQIDVNLFV